MRSRVVLAAVALVALALAAWALVRGGPGVPPRPSPSPRPVAPSAAPAADASPAPDTRRNIFRFADEARAEESRPPAGARRRVEPSPPPTPPPPPGPRLVGLVHRGGRVVAALSGPDGEVELAGPGESAAGVVVVAIADDSVRVRRPDGTEETLGLP